MSAVKGMDNIGEKYKMQNQLVASLALFSGKDARRMRRKTLSTVRHTCEDLHFRCPAREFAFSVRRVSLCEFQKAVLCLHKRQQKYSQLVFRKIEKQFFLYIISLYSLNISVSAHRCTQNV